MGQIKKSSPWLFERRQSIPRSDGSRGFPAVHAGSRRYQKGKTKCGPKNKILFLFLFIYLFIYLFIIYLFIYLFMAVLGLHFCARAFSSCGKWGPLFIAVCGPLLLRSTGSRRAGSVVVAHGPSCSAACGIFPDQGSNPCPLRWQADSQPLRHQGSPCSCFDG